MAQRHQKLKPDISLSVPPEGVIDYALVYSELKKEYQLSAAAVEVNFRELVKFHSGIDRHTHLFHAYPAKLLLNIPHFFINCSSLIGRTGTVLDPFCGSGTVLLESIISGKSAIGADANPLARLITKAKTTPLNKERLEKILSTILIESKKTRTVDLPQDFLEWEYWYPEKVKRQLGRLLHIIRQLPNNEYRTFFEVCFSACTRKVSLADPLVSVPVKLNPKRFKGKKRADIKTRIQKIENMDVFDCFSRIAEGNIKRISLLSELNFGSVKNIYEDAQNLSAIKDKSVDLIVTSPPYAGAQKYIRASSLNIGWLSLSPDATLRSLEKKNIGREHYSKDEYSVPLVSPTTSAQKLLDSIFKINPLRAHIAANYLIEMKKALQESYRVLKDKGSLVLVVGNNVVCGKDFETQKFLRDICEDIGFKVEVILRDDIHSRGLMTKRNKTASVITCEWILVFKK